LSRVIHLDGVGKQRTQLTRAVVLALRELMQQQQADEQTRDLAAFISLALEAIHETIDTSVDAWEKRGYWLKADRFRMEWAWTEKFSQAIRKALMVGDWAALAVSAGQVAEKLKDVKVPQRHRLGTPWVGAWKKLQDGQSKNGGEFA
jgi:hypothetical protein